MYWSPEIKEKMTILVADSPMNYKKFFSNGVLEASIESQAKKLGKTDIDEESLVRGYITAVPRHLRDGIEESLSEHKYDLIYFRPVFDEPNFLNHHSDHRPHA
jgi:hypothetical protein